MGLIFFYGLTTQVPAVAWVSVAGVVLVYILGVIVRRVAPGMAEREDRDRADDVSEPDQVAAVVKQIRTDLGGIDVLHSNAGRLRAGTVLEVPLAEWNRIFAVNVTAMFLVAGPSPPSCWRGRAARSSPLAR